MKQLLMLLLVTATSYTQTNSSQQIFKSPDGTFMFRYPSSVVLCQPQYEKPMPDTDGSKEALEPRLVGWTPDSCGAYMPICPTSEVMATDTGPLHPDAIACVAYPNSAYEGTDFSGGAFSVSEISDATTESDCLQFDRLTTDPKKARWQRVGGIKFKANRGAEGGLGHGLSKDIYLAFHDGKCYDVEIRMAGLASTAFDSETYKKMEFKDYGRVERQFRRVLNSFCFLK
jgi:hypothetical protein